VSPSAVPSQADLDAALSRVIDTVRRMPPGRLRAALAHSGAGGEVATRAGAARALARALAIAAQGVEAAGSVTPPVWHDLPDVPDLVVGDQLAVLAHDLRLALADGAPAEVWTPSGRAPLSDVLAELFAVSAKTRSVL
jgi:hypothetical protein